MPFIHITARSRRVDALHMVREERRRAVAHAPVACAVARGLAARAPCAPCEVRDEGQRARGRFAPVDSMIIGITRAPWASAWLYLPSTFLTKLLPVA